MIYFVLVLTRTLLDIWNEFEIDAFFYRCCYGIWSKGLQKGAVSTLKREIYPLYVKVSDEFVSIDAEYQFDEDGDFAKVKVVVDENIIEVSGDCTENVFKVLSQKLSDRYEIHSCYTCRYGNFCPYGDRNNEIFCIKDFEPKCKEDILFIFDDVLEMKKRSRTLFDVCSEFDSCDEHYWRYK